MLFLCEKADALVAYSGHSSYGLSLPVSSADRA
jgi:hypothetical protein